MAKNQYVYGIHAVTTLLECHPERVLHLWLDEKQTASKLKNIHALVQTLGLKSQHADRKTLDKLSFDGNHQGVVVEAKLPEEKSEQALKAAIQSTEGDCFYLVLDQVTDPHNLGACMRTALASGVQGIIVPKDNACRLNATVCKVASGAAERLPLYRVTNLARTLKWLKEQGIWLTGAAGETEQSIFDANLKGSVAIVMGAEGKGLRQLTRQHCDQFVKIPMSSAVESLNVSVATGVILYEVVRQRRT